jgi:Flp pilus assembly CpaF family ATPase
MLATLVRAVLDPALRPLPATAAIRSRLEMAMLTLPLDTHADLRQVAAQAFRDRLAPLLEAANRWPEATEVLVDGDELRIDIGERVVRLDRADLPRFSERDIRAAVDAAAVFAGVEFGGTGTALPILSVKIPPDLRVSCCVPPAADRLHLAVRFLRARELTLEDYLRQQVITGEQLSHLRELLAGRKNIIVSGGTATGKTTLLRALLREIADHDRLVILEDTPELSLEGQNVVELHTTLTVGLATLLRQALRMRPDRLILGEVRGPEALELVRAMNTGHDGTLATLHSNGAEEAIRRLHTLVAEAQPAFPFEAIRAAVDYVVQLTGRGRARRLAEIWQVSKA